jgi:hypothetical protein
MFMMTSLKYLNTSGAVLLALIVVRPRLPASQVFVDGDEVATARPTRTHARKPSSALHASMHSEVSLTHIPVPRALSLSTYVYSR